jgi:hypothetical protein
VSPSPVEWRGFASHHPLRNLGTLLRSSHQGWPKETKKGFFLLPIISLAERAAVSSLPLTSGANLPGSPGIVAPGTRLGQGRGMGPMLEIVVYLTVKRKKVLDRRSNM